MNIRRALGRAKDPQKKEPRSGCEAIWRPKPLRPHSPPRLLEKYKYLSLLGKGS
jgi:hypothetical protein